MLEQIVAAGRDQRDVVETADGEGATEAHQHTWRREGQAEGGCERQGRGPVWKGRGPVWMCDCEAHSGPLYPRTRGRSGPRGGRLRRRLDRRYRGWGGRGCERGWALGEGPGRRRRTRPGRMAGRGRGREVDWGNTGAWRGGTGELVRRGEERWRRPPGRRGERGEREPTQSPGLGSRHRSRHG